MKYRLLSPVFAIGMLLFNYATNAQTSVQDEKVRKMLKEFYSGYISTSLEVEQSAENTAKQESLKKRYCTKGLLAWISRQELFDADPFLNAQDFSVDWIRTMTIKNDSKSPNVYLVSFFDKESNTSVKVHVTVVKQNDSYKISAVR